MIASVSFLVAKVARRARGLVVTVSPRAMATSVRLAALIVMAAAAPAGAPAPAAGSCAVIDEVPFDFVGGQVRVAVSLDGAPARRLLLDTGAEEHYLWSDAAAALGWELGEKIVRRDAI